MPALTTYIVTSRRAGDSLRDTLRSVRWGSTEPAILVAATAAAADPPGDDCCDVALAASEQCKTLAFMAGDALRWCLQNGNDSRQFVLLADDCLVIQRGLDAWAAGVLQRAGSAVVGVLDHASYSSAYDSVRPWFAELSMPHVTFEPGPETLADSVLVLSRDAAERLYSFGVFNSAYFNNWPLPFGVLLSWSAQMLGIPQIGWGSVVRRMPPLFCTDHRRAGHVEPQALSEQFVLYSSVQRCLGYSEFALRELYRRKRGEAAPTWTPLKPTVSPRSPLVTEAG